MIVFNLNDPVNKNYVNVLFFNRLAESFLKFQHLHVARSLIGIISIPGV